MKEEFEYNSIQTCRDNGRVLMPTPSPVFSSMSLSPRTDGNFFSLEDMPTTGATAAAQHQQQGGLQNDFAYYNPFTAYLGNYFDAATKMIKEKEDNTLSPPNQSKEKMNAISPIQLKSSRLSLKGATENNDHMGGTTEENGFVMQPEETSASSYRHIANKLLSGGQKQRSAYIPEQKMNIPQRHLSNSMQQLHEMYFGTQPHYHHHSQHQHQPPPPPPQIPNGQFMTSRETPSIRVDSPNTSPHSPQQQQRPTTLASQRLISSDEAKKQCKVNKRGVPTRGTTIITSNGALKGTWTEDEHNKFMEGLSRFERGKWKEIAELVGTRTRVQVASHAQKYFRKMERRSSILKRRAARKAAAAEKKKMKRAQRAQRKKKKEISKIFT